MTDINHLALETFGTRGRPQSKWKGSFYITQRKRNMLMLDEFKSVTMEIVYIP